ncbi:dipeptidase D [Lachnospiraceae bacterium]|nr:dipeptidase D [Lachnospiraceae bacterium]
MRVLENLEPKKVFQFFEDITQIPHGSYNEKAISDYCVKFAKDRGLEVEQDDLYDVIIKCPATPGYENVPGVILQGHLDMVNEKEDTCTIDMDKEGLQLEIVGDNVTAKGTTLGGDDGIAIAYALAIMDSDDIPHPSIEAVFTVSEETGMEGASHIDLSGLKNRRMLNMDSEDEGIFLTSCAGGGRVDSKLEIKRETKSGVAVHVDLKGFTGGHSGIQIILGGANANIMAGRVAAAVTEKTGAALIGMKGGSKDNAIPRASELDFIVPADQISDFRAAAEAEAEKIKDEFSVQDPSFNIVITEKGESSAEVLTAESLDSALSLLFALPNGVQAMSADVENMVETSLNLGVMGTEEKFVHYRYAVRSSVNSAKEFLIGRMKRIIEHEGAEYSFEGAYPAWEYRKDSKLRDDMVRIWTEMYGKTPIVQGIHAGVECGLFSDKLDGIDAVSFGPQMSGVHTPEETLSISSTKRVWDFILKVLAVKD